MRKALQESLKLWCLRRAGAADNGYSDDSLESPMSEGRSCNLIKLQQLQFQWIWPLLWTEHSAAKNLSCFSFRNYMWRVTSINQVSLKHIAVGMSNGRVEKKSSLLLEINNLKHQAKMERFGDLRTRLLNILQFNAMHCALYSVDRDKPVNSEMEINWCP